VSDLGTHNQVPAATAQAVLRHIVTSLVDDTEAVHIDVERGGRRNVVSLEVRVAPGELGRVIGKRGRTAQAIRAVVRAAAAKDDVEVDVEFVD
jgi:predicted RNA-binding protein YlqC (UPF0109 family)